MDIADSLVKPTTDLRNLEERCFHLHRANTPKSYFSLKETLSNIENFLLFFNPINKFNFSFYWSVLIDKNYEPVIEFNKSIEFFTLRYLPDTQTTFQIFFQVAVFLKEFSDFEKPDQPSFRHPHIVGDSEIDEIGLYKEIDIMNMYFGPLTNLKKIKGAEYITKFSEPKILEDWEDLNVDIPSKRKRMRKYFVDYIKE